MKIGTGRAESLAIEHQKASISQEMMSMHLFNRDNLKALMEVRSDPSISLYLPVQREGADTRQGPVKLRSQVKGVEELLKKQGWRLPLIEQILKPVTALYDDALFWEYQQSGLAIFANADSFLTYQLPIEVAEKSMIADRFYTRPLIPLLIHDGPYVLLAINLNEVKVYQGSRYQLKELQLEGMPKSLQAIYDTYATEKQIQHHAGAAASGSSGKAVFHGGENAKDVEKQRIEEYCRQIDTSLRQSLGGETMPLVVACVEYLFPVYRQVSKSKQLMPVNISGSPDGLGLPVMRDKAWEIVRPIYEGDQVKAWTASQDLLGSDRVRGNIRQIIIAADHGRVESLFLPAGGVMPGVYDPETERIERLLDEDADQRGVAADLFDVAAASVLLKGGHVYQVTADQLPPDSDALAVLRY
jgi:hypothetical protein